MSNKLFRKSVEINEINESNKYIIATVSTSQPDKQKDVITPTALSKVLEAQKEDVIPLNIEHKGNKNFGYADLSKTSLHKYYVQDGLGKLELYWNIHDTALGEKGLDLVKSGKNFTSIEGKGSDLIKSGIYTLYNTLELTGCAITSSPANPGARIKEFKKSFTEIFAGVTNRKDWKAAVDEYVIESASYAPEPSNSLLNTLWDVIAFLEYDTKAPQNLTDKVASILDLFTANGIYSIEDELIQPMAISVKNILAKNKVASNTTGLQKSQTEIASHTISKGHNNLASFLNQGLQKSYNNNNL